MGTPEDVFKVHEALFPISPMFTIAAAFGNVHGVYKAGNVKLQPELLGQFQTFCAAKCGTENPYFFVFHGGSGSEKSDIAVVGAHYVRHVAPAYGVPVFCHSDHCAKKLLPWFDDMLEANGSDEPDPRNGDWHHWRC